MLTEMFVLRPALSLTVIVHVPAPTGVTLYVADPAVFAVGTTAAISPVYGLQVSLSMNVPE
jgi:hypothetical protein